jgi:holo-[acyl-carrier protein] synthase
LHGIIKQSQNCDDLVPVLCGIDLVEYEGFRRYVEEGGDRFLERNYTQAEREYCQHRISCLSARWAVKEAVAKALGTGLRGVRPVEIETRNSPQGKPSLQLHGNAAAVAAQLGITDWEISLSHEQTCAIAIAIAAKQGCGTEEWQTAVMDTVQVALQQKNKASGVFDEVTEKIFETIAEERQNK